MIARAQPMTADAMQVSGQRGTRSRDEDWRARAPGKTPACARLEQFSPRPHRCTGLHPVSGPNPKENIMAKNTAAVLDEEIESGFH